MAKIKKAIIPAAGYGVNFLPATKAQPKELLPIVDKPIIQFIVEEAFASGIEEILIITGKHKRSIEDHFDSNFELEENLESKGKDQLLEIVKSTTKDNLFYVRQAYPLGLGDAILHAKAFVNQEPFVVMLGDNIMRSEVPVTKQLMDLYEMEETANLAVVEVKTDEIPLYGIVDVADKHPSIEQVCLAQRFVEKPHHSEAPSKLAIAGRYVLTHEIFDILEATDPELDQEHHLTEAINQLNQQKPVLVKQVEGQRYDVGNKLGYVNLCLQYGLQHEETKEEFSAYLKQLSQSLKA